MNDVMTTVEKKAFKKCVDESLLAMDMLRAKLMKVRDMENPLDMDESIVESYNNTSEKLDIVMDALGFCDDEEEYES